MVFPSPSLPRSCGLDEEATPTSQPCTPQPGSDSIVLGGAAIGSSNNSDGRNSAALATSDQTAAVSPAVNDAAAQGAGSNQSAFSAIFRRYLTAMAVPPATPASSAATDDASLGQCSHYPQQQTGGSDISGISTAFCSTATDEGESSGGGGGGGVAEPQVWDEEEKRSENVAAVAPPQRLSRPAGFRLFRNGGGDTDGPRGGRDGTGSPPPALAISWRARVWASVRSVGGGAGGNYPVGSVQGAGGGVPSNISAPERSSEEALQINRDRRGAPVAPVAGSTQGRGEDRAMVETMSHRRRTARRVAGSRAAGEGGRRSCDGEFRAPGPATRDDGRDNCGDVAAGSGRDGGGAGVPAGVTESDARVGNHDGRATAGHLLLPEVVAAGADAGALADEYAPSGRSSCRESEEEPEGARQEVEAMVIRRTAEHPLTGGGGTTGPLTAFSGFSTGRDVAAAARTSSAIPPASQHRREERGPGDAGNGRGGRGAGGAEEIEAGGGGDCVSPLGEPELKSPVLPRARVLWRAFSEVDHDTITENHRLAGLRHLARFAPAPGIENPPMCYVPLEG